MKKIGLLGGGAWGTAVAHLLADNGYEIHLWCFEKEVVGSIASQCMNKRYLPDIYLPSSIVPTDSLSDVFQECSIIFEAIPVPHIRRVFEAARQHINGSHKFILLSKGLEYDTLMLPSQIVSSVIGDTYDIAIAAGPTFAHEVALEHVTALTVASKNLAFITEVKELLANDYCRPYSSMDSIGVQCGGAFKNALALGLGILDGAGCADNTKAFVFVRGFHEIGLCCTALGGNRETMVGLSGLGDLVLTSMGQLSRNSYLGKCIGKGKSVEAITQELGTIPEGINTVASMMQLKERYNLDLPVFAGINALLNKTLSVGDFLCNLIDRPLEPDVI